MTTPKTTPKTPPEIMAARSKPPYAAIHRLMEYVFKHG